MALCCECRCDCLQLIGGLTVSIFPEAERMLIEDTDFQKALEFVAARKAMEQYRSVIDFLFCELHPEWKPACQKFYNNQGSPLRDLVSVGEIERLSQRMVIALLVAKELLDRKFCHDWDWYRETVEQALQAA